MKKITLAITFLFIVSVQHLNARTFADPGAKLEGYKAKTSDSGAAGKEQEKAVPGSLNNDNSSDMANVKLKAGEILIPVNEPVTITSVGVPSAKIKDKIKRRESARNAAILSAKYQLISRLKPDFVINPNNKKNQKALDKIKGQIMQATYDEEDNCEVVFIFDQNQNIVLSE
jgi:hypothetical protein